MCSCCSAYNVLCKLCLAKHVPHAFGLNRILHLFLERASCQDEDTVSGQEHKGTSLSSDSSKKILKGVLSFRRALPGQAMPSNQTAPRGHSPHSGQPWAGHPKSQTAFYC